MNKHCPPVIAWSREIRHSAEPRNPSLRGAAFEPLKRRKRTKQSRINAIVRKTNLSSSLFAVLNFLDSEGVERL